MARYGGSSIPWRYVFFATVLVLTPQIARAWTPPLGIPGPPFGINEVAPATPNPWTAAVSGFYYVDPSSASATDSSNPNGWPAKPRLTIPNPIPAGAVIELHGTYSRNHTSPNTLRFSGTAARPAFLRGPTAGPRPKVTGSWEVTGSYFVIENIGFEFKDAMKSTMAILTPTDHGVLRSCDLRGNTGGGGVFIGSFGAGGTVNNVVISQNIIHDNGDRFASFDQDIHGINVGAPTNNLWILDNEFFNNSGDGVQLNGGGGQSSLHHVYLGRNVSHHNKQTGLWTKQAVDVIFSQNVAYSHRPSNSSPGSCLGFQYAPERVWFLFNHVYDCDNGISSGSDNDLGTGKDSYFIGNLIQNIHGSGGFDPNTAWSSAGIMMAGGTNRYFINNTFYDVDSGINIPSAGANRFVNNIIAGVTQSRGYHIFLENPSGASASTTSRNLFGGTTRIRWGSTTVYNLSSFQSAFPGQCSGCLNADPQFVGAASLDFHLQLTSPAIDHGVVSAVYATFQSLYGIDIARDIEGALRPLGTTWDMGAYEADIFKPDVIVGDATIPEGNTGISLAALPLSLSGASSRAVTISYSTADSTAIAGSDYLASSGVVVIPAGSTSGTLNVGILGDRVYEAPESFLVNLTGAVNGIIVDGQANVSITNDDAQGLSVNDVTVVESKAGTKIATFTVTLAPTLAQAATVDYATANGTAVAGSDFVATSGTLSFPAGTATRSVPVTINADALREPVETLTFNLSNPTGGAAIASGQGTGRIYDPGSFNSLSPCRVLDTRKAPGPLGGPALTANTVRTFTLAGVCGIPSTARGVSLNLTVTQGTAAGNLRLYAAGEAAPLASVINYLAGSTRANSVVGSLSSTGQIAVRCDQASGSVHLIVDVNGYFE